MVTDAVWEFVQNQNVTPGRDDSSPNVIGHTMLHVLKNKGQTTGPLLTSALQIIQLPSFSK